jgi:hypothetical protein
MNQASPFSRAAFPTADDLMADARRATGLSDFGPDTFREGLDRLLAHFKQDATSSDAYIAQQLDIARRRLTNRLEIEETIRRNPEIASSPIDQLVSITGLARTGTTALANIMSQDDSFRTPRRWEIEKPCPPPVLGQEKDDPRRLAVLRYFEELARDQPEQFVMHLYDADAAEEDLELLGLDFKAQQLAQPLFGYHAWWRTADLRSTYAYHRRTLQLLQWRRPPNRWLLKFPGHMFHMEALVSAYPNARFVMTHRDPAEAIPSVMSLLSSLLVPEKSRGPDLKTFARHHMEHCRVGLERAIAARKRISEDRFIDIYHRDFNRDPFGTLDRIYAFLGKELRPEARAAMERWHVKNRSGAYGEHRYTPEQFGFTTAQLRSDFDFYIKRFDVPLD